VLIEVIGMPWGSMPCGGFQEAKNRPCLGYQPETEGAKPRTPLFKISNNLLILGEELSEVREIEKPGNLGQTGFPRVLKTKNGEPESSPNRILPLLGAVSHAVTQPVFPRLIRPLCSSLFKPKIRVMATQ
jgi:hypothetical protein